MALPTPTFPDANWDGNEQDTTYDGAADATLAQAADINEVAAELLAVQQLLRGTVAAHHAGAVQPCVNKTGGTLTCGKWVCLNGVDVTTGLPSMTLGAANAASCTDGLGLLVMEKGGDVDTVADNGIGYVVALGMVANQNTDSMGVAGTYLWPAASGGLSSTAIAGYLPVAEVDVKSATVGVLRIFPTRKQFATHLTIDEALNVAVGTSVGTRIGTTSLQKLALWGATPIVRPAHIADPTGSTVASLRAAMLLILARLEAVGISKTS